MCGCRACRTAAQQPPPSDIVMAVQLLKASPDFAAAALCVLADLLSDRKAQQQPQQSDDTAAPPLPLETVQVLGAAFQRPSLMKAAEAQRPGSVLQVLLGAASPACLPQAAAEHRLQPASLRQLLPGLAFVCRHIPEQELLDGSRPAMADDLARLALLEQVSREAGPKGWLALPWELAMLLEGCLDLAHYFSAAVGAAIDAQLPKARTSEAPPQAAPQPPLSPLHQPPQQQPQPQQPQKPQPGAADLNHAVSMLRRCMGAADYAGDSEVSAGVNISHSVIRTTNGVSAG